MLSQFQLTGDLVSSLHSHCLALRNIFRYSLKSQTPRHIKWGFIYPSSLKVLGLVVSLPSSTMFERWWDCQLHWVKDFVYFSAPIVSPQGVLLACRKVYRKTVCHAMTPAPLYRPQWPHLNCIKKSHVVTGLHQQGLCVTLCDIHSMTVTQWHSQNLSLSLSNVHTCMHASAKHEFRFHKLFVL